MCSLSGIFIVSYYTFETEETVQSAYIEIKWKYSLCL